MNRKPVRLPLINVRRTVAVTFNGAAAWKKWAYDSDRRLDTWRGKALAKLTGIAFLKPTHFCDVRAGLAFEAARLDDLHAMGFAVPRVLDRDPDGEWIVTSHIGEDLRRVMRKADPAQRHTILTMAAEQLAFLHAYGQFHGRPSLRDLTLGRKGIGFIDLDHDALKVMSLADVQARDALIFMLGASRYESADTRLTAHLAEAYLRKAPVCVHHALKDALRRLTPFSKAVSALCGARQPRLSRVINALDRGLQRRHSASHDAVHTAAQPA